MAPHAAGPCTSVDDVIITSALSERAPRPPDREAENRSLVMLARTMAESPDQVFQTLANCALELCRAGSAGISVLDAADPKVFRWRATAGAYAPYVGATLPRDFSPCGVVLDRKSFVLMANPARFFPYISDLCAPVREVLLVPFAQDGVLVGTVWVVAHDETRRFDAEDARIVTSLTGFAEAAIQTLNRIEAAESAERLRRVRDEHFVALVTATSDVVYCMNADWSEMQPLDGRDLVASNSAPIRDWLSNLPAFEHARVREAIACAIAQKHVFELEHQVSRPDGSLAWIFSRAMPILDAQGSIAEWLGIASDITARKKAEDVLREQERQAREHAVLAEQLVGIVSHDLRTPLQVISLGAAALASNPLDLFATRTVARISAAATRAGSLISDLLDFTQSRLGSGLRVHPIELNLHKVIAEVVEELKLAAPGRMIEHRRRGSGDGIADSSRIWQLVTNLANNALTYGDPTFPVTITSLTSATELVIEVHNRGAPIPVELQRQVFEPLRRGEQQVALGSRSVGLGLYIVQQIAVAHSGQVTLTSTAEAGTTFVVRIPVLRRSVTAN